MEERSAILKVGNMSCGNCSDAVKNLIEEVNGVRNAEVELNTGRVRVLFETTTSEEGIMDHINGSSTY